MKAYSLDFRQKIIDVYENEPISQRALAQRFHVAKSFIQKILKQYRDTGSLAPKQRTQYIPTKLTNEHLALLQQLLEEKNDATLDELRTQLEARSGVCVSRTTVFRTLKQLGITVKKKHSTPMRKKRNESKGSE